MTNIRMKIRDLCRRQVDAVYAQPTKVGFVVPAKGWFVSLSNGSPPGSKVQYMLNHSRNPRFVYVRAYANHGF